MKIQDLIKQSKELVDYLLNFIDDADNNEDNYRNLIYFFDHIKIGQDRVKLLNLIYLLSIISNYHHRQHDFFDKITKIVNFIRNDIKKLFADSEILELFKSNKRILL